MEILDKRERKSNKQIRKNKTSNMDKLTKKRLQAAIDNEEKCFGGVPTGHYSQAHIEEQARQRDFKFRKMKEKISNANAN